MEIAVKQQVGHIAVNGIIYRATNPEEIFTDIKDNTYPLIVWRGCVCLIGGNWTGKGARYDVSPLATFAREIEEELSFAKPIQSTAELGETLVSHTAPITYRVKGLDKEATLEDEADLRIVKRAIVRSARSFDDYIVTVPHEVFLRGDPETKQTTMIALVCVLDVGLDEETWTILARLQREFGNISCESESHILSIDNMIENNILAMSGQDKTLQEFFESKVIMRERVLPTDPVVSVRRASVHPRFSYWEYLKHYSVTRKPEGW